MFKIKYDLTEGRLKRSGRHSSPGAVLHSPRGAKRIAALKKQRTASITDFGVNSPGSAGYGMQQTYSPVYDRAEVPTLGEQFLPADSASQNKLFEEIAIFDPVVSPTLEYWKDLAFSEEIILSAIKDPKILQFYNDAISSSHIVPLMPELLHDFLVFGKLVAHMLFDESLGYWTETIPHNLNFLSIQLSPVPNGNPIIDIQPTAEMRKWASSKDPRIVLERQSLDPVFVKLMAEGKQIPLAPENTIFLPRRAFSWDNSGTSYLTRVLLFKVYEAAIFNASVAGARRRAGPLLHIQAYDDATDQELTELLDLFFASEEDPVGAKIVTKKGVEVNSIGGGPADYWKLSDEWAFLTEGKMRALGVSETLVTGESNWNSMETIRTVFVEKLQFLRSFFTKKIIVDRMLRSLAERNDFVIRKTAELDHHYRIGRPQKKSMGELQIPVVEWNRPLTPTRDEEFVSLLRSLRTDDKLPVNLRMMSQAAGVDIDKILNGLQDDIELRKKIYTYTRSLAILQKQMGIDAEGNFIGMEEGAAEGGELGWGGEDLGLGGGGFEEAPLGLEAPTAPEAPAAPEAAPAPAEEGAGASGQKGRFKIKSKPAPRFIAAAGPPHYAQLDSKAIMDKLSELPVWDKDDTMLGVYKRHAAHILYALATSDPSTKSREKAAKTLYPTLRKEGYDNVQAQAIEYLAMRLGYIPPVELDDSMYSILSNHISERANGNGLTRVITEELVAITKLARLARNEEALKVEPRTIWKQLIANKHEANLPNNQILTGVVKPDEVQS